MWLQENLLAVGVFGLCTALVQVRRAPQGTKPQVPCPRGAPSPGGGGSVRVDREPPRAKWRRCSLDACVRAVGTPSPVPAAPAQRVVLTGLPRVEGGWAAQALTAGPAGVLRPYPWPHGIPSVCILGAKPCQ